MVGSGHSALTAVIELAQIARANPGTRITWALRRGVVGNTFGGGAADELPQRGALGIRASEAVDAGLVDVVTGFRIEQIAPHRRAASSWSPRTAAHCPRPTGSSS